MGSQGLAGRRAGADCRSPSAAPRRSPALELERCSGRPLCGCVAAPILITLRSIHGPHRMLSENGYVESFNARLRDELLDGELFYTLQEAKVVIEGWRRHCKP